ncbi:extracellular catalytic domain type 1 short-chain-length polyhydroxyalkanoate depolymerase [Azospirillum isscasi]|uniref:PHB depolymerase family esterase n=1 Tax=Azospirillum isscasi TaxID=3053926 RepID=A0ABU0WKG1_9PROT|nr:PHB depolymerase family esterase [Azospirillum isscasi]MDQ2104650.1 PHB depolymerase family esterase [Azospirillum isscasi]
MTDSPRTRLIPARAVAFLRRIAGQGRIAAMLRKIFGRAAPASPPPERAPVPAPAAEPMAPGTFANGAGSLAYRLFVPKGSAAGPRPLLVMLHGCTQSPEDFAAGTRMNRLAEEAGCLVLYPEQTPAANDRKCWNWFNPGHQRRGQGEPSLIAGATGRILADLGADPQRVYVAGISAGGSAAMVMATAYPDLFAAVGVHSGLPYGSASGVPSALMAMKSGSSPGQRPAAGTPVVPAIVFHGDADKVVHPRNGDHVTAQAIAAAGDLTAETEEGQAPGGRDYTRTLHKGRDGKTLCEQWTVHGSGHAWSGGSPDGTYTDPQGPDAAREMLRFFLSHRHPAPGGNA